MHQLQFHPMQSARNGVDTTFHGTCSRLETFEACTEANQNLCCAKPKRKNVCIVISNSKTCSPGFSVSNSSQTTKNRQLEQEQKRHRFVAKFPTIRPHIKHWDGSSQTLKIFWRVRASVTVAAALGPDKYRSKTKKTNQAACY